VSQKSGLRTFTTTSQPTILKLLSEPSPSSTKAQLLRNHPRLGYKYEPERSREVRILLYEHYRITYLVKPGGNIEILGVFHGALDIDRYFNIEAAADTTQLAHGSSDLVMKVASGSGRPD
jgi:hypothetical protein